MFKIVSTTRQQDTMNIFSQLPNDLIMRIIRETKSSVHFKKEHETKMKVVLEELMCSGYYVWWCDYNYTVGKKGYEHRTQEWMTPWGGYEDDDY